MGEHFPNVCIQIQILCYVLILLRYCLYKGRYFQGKLVSTPVLRLSPTVLNEQWMPVVGTEQDNIETNLFLNFIATPYNFKPFVP